MVYFIDNDMSCNPENQLFLRNHVRCLFLDPFASDLGKLVWLDYICADYICAKGLAKLILLLYSPMTTSGKQNSMSILIQNLRESKISRMKESRMIWRSHRINNKMAVIQSFIANLTLILIDTSTYMISDFAIYSESFHMFTNAFVSMAHTIGLLKFIQNESPALPLQVLNFLIGKYCIFSFFIFIRKIWNYAYKYFKYHFDSFHIEFSRCSKLNFDWNEITN